MLSIVNSILLPLLYIWGLRARFSSPLNELYLTFKAELSI